MGEADETPSRMLCTAFAADCRLAAVNHFLLLKTLGVVGFIMSVRALLLQALGFLAQGVSHDPPKRSSLCSPLTHHSSLHAEVLFGPVTVAGGETQVGTFPMYSGVRRTSLREEQGADSCMVLLNRREALRMGRQDRVSSVQAELREDGPNEIEIRAMGAAEAACQCRCTSEA